MVSELVAAVEIGMVLLIHVLTILQAQEKALLISWSILSWSESMIPIPPPFDPNPHFCQSHRTPFLVSGSFWN